MADPESINFFHRNIQFVFTGAGLLVMWLLKVLGAKVIAQYITREQLSEVLKEHSESVKKERQDEHQAFEDRLFVRLVKALKS